MGVPPDHPVFLDFPYINHPLIGVAYLNMAQNASTEPTPGVWPARAESSGSGCSDARKDGTFPPGALWVVGGSWNGGVQRYTHFVQFFH